MSSVYEDAKNRGEKAVAELIGRPESFLLEFKEKARSGFGEVDKSDKRMIGAALSAFSNADGGVLVVGIKTRNVGGIDIAHELCPITNVARFKSEIDGLLDELLRPTNPGIVTLAVQCGDDPARGYLVLHIPATDNKPHMSMAPEHQKYFRRSGTQTIFMDHTMVRELILSRRNAILNPDWHMLSKSWRGGDNRMIGRYQLGLYLRNLSQVMAAVPYVRIWMEPKLNPFNINGHALAQQRVDGSTAFIGSRDFLIPPGDEVPIAGFDLEITVESRRFRKAVADADKDKYETKDIWEFGKEFNGGSMRDPFEDIQVELSLGAENCPLITTNLSLNKKRIIELASFAAVRQMHKGLP